MKATVPVAIGLCLLWSAALVPVASASPPAPPNLPLCFDVPDLPNPGVPVFARYYSNPAQIGVAEWYLSAWHFQGYCNFAALPSPPCLSAPDFINLAIRIEDIVPSNVALSAVASLVLC